MHLKSTFFIKSSFFCWSPKSPLKVSWRSRTLRPIGDLQGTSPGRRVPAGFRGQLIILPDIWDGCFARNVQKLKAVHYFCKNFHFGCLARFWIYFWHCTKNEVFHYVFLQWMWPNPQFSADLVTFTEEICNGKLHFLCSVK